jgi:hypothetical protein
MAGTDIPQNPRSWAASELLKLARAVIKVGDGRGFVVASEDGDRLILTAAHCLPQLPPAHSWSHIEERTYQALLCHTDKPSGVSAECLFADPIADIAVLGSVDEQMWREKAEAYEMLVSEVEPFVIGNAPEQMFETRQLSCNRARWPGDWTAIRGRKRPNPDRGIAATDQNCA